MDIVWYRGHPYRSLYDEYVAVCNPAVFAPGSESESESRSKYEQVLSLLRIVVESRVPEEMYVLVFRRGTRNPVPYIYEQFHVVFDDLELGVGYTSNNPATIA